MKYFSTSIFRLIFSWTILYLFPPTRAKDMSAPIPPPTIMSKTSLGWIGSTSGSSSSRSSSSRSCSLVAASLNLKSDHHLLD